MRKIILIIRDGWGHSEEVKGNAVKAAKTPNDDFYIKNYPTTVLKAIGNDVGNPNDVQGGSEIGHLTMGAGRIVWQPYELINRHIKDGSFFKNEVLLKAIDNCKQKNSDLHISGLFSDQGVHADIKHMFLLLGLAKKNNFDRVYVHLCLDGRDMPERSAIRLINQLEKEIKKIGLGKIASIIGRYYGMDRDKNWDRTKKFYGLLVDGKGFRANTAKEGIEEAYKRGDKTDYYVQPTVIVNNGKPIALLKNNDSFIWTNFRSDRSKQITAMINDFDYCTEKSEKKMKIHYVCFCSYDNNWNLPIAFPQQNVENNLGSIIASKNLKQLRIAETEKYPHVTFFFNSQVEKPYKGENRILVPSPKVASYDLKPEMSAYGVTKKLLPEIGKYDFIILNYANPDLVGHSGVFESVVKACEVVDECVGQIIERSLNEDYTILLTADHGNAEHMINADGSVDPSHGFNPVRLTLISNDEKLKNCKLKKDKGLKDIAPTILELMKISKPKEMTGESLIIE